jgi:hypothetical protein
MKDTREWAEKLRREAEECRLISKLATNLEKRETFARLAEAIDRQAGKLEGLIASGSLQDIQWLVPEKIIATAIEEPMRSLKHWFGALSISPTGAAPNVARLGPSEPVAFPRRGLVL